MRYRTYGLMTFQWRRIHISFGDISRLSSSRIFVSVIVLIQNCLRSDDPWGVAHETYDPVATRNFTYDRSDMRSANAQLSHTGNIIILLPSIILPTKYFTSRYPSIRSWVPAPVLTTTHLQPLTPVLRMLRIEMRPSTYIVGYVGSWFSANFSNFGTLKVSSLDRTPVPTRYSHCVVLMAGLYWLYYLSF
jgi:hypothetical protein